MEVSLVLHKEIGDIFREVYQPVYHLISLPEEIELKWFYAMNELVRTLLQRKKYYSSNTHTIGSIELSNTLETNVTFMSIETKQRFSHSIIVQAIHTSKKQSKVTIQIN